MGVKLAARCQKQGGDPLHNATLQRSNVESSQEGAQPCLLPNRHQVRHFPCT